MQIPSGDDATKCIPYQSITYDEVGNALERIEVQYVDYKEVIPVNKKGNKYSVKQKP